MPRRSSITRGLASLAVLSASGCATDGLGSLPLPAPGSGGGGYLITAVFADALNVPAHATVKLAGADIGQLESITAHNYTAVMTLRIKDGVQVPRGSGAELRSATPLGDVFIALKPPSPSEPDTSLLENGDTIGLESTKAAATVESVLGTTALIVNGGAVRNLTDFVNGAGKASGDQGQALGNLLAQSNELLAKLNARSDQFDAATTETARLADRLSAKNDAISDLVVSARPAADALATNVDQLVDVITQLGLTSRQLTRFPAIAGTDTSGRSMIRDLDTIAGAWNDVAKSPDTSLAALNRLMPPFIKSTTSQSISVRASIDRLILGSMPDAGFDGDPAFHGPKRYDWAKLVGSVKYALWRLQERVVGQGPNSPMGQNDWTPAGPPLPPLPGAADQDPPR
ncbi:MlaD family protein [Mycolicibacterium cosmeticum]|uniref:MlaD family protein n=1 Tax=Mycolicibacterium cosmeticum TaxID=258533 RepID=UPI003204FC4C